jgi:transcription termination/antitermination protein NusG
VTDESNQVADEETVKVASDVSSEPAAVDSSAASNGHDASEAPQAVAESAQADEQEAANQLTEEAQAEESEESDDQEPAVESSSGPVYMAPPEEDDLTMDWYILKVQSNRERSIAEAVERKMKVEGLERYFDQVIVPTEKVTEFKGGKKKIVERKLYPGYIVVHMHINDDTWFAIRETSGVGDFTGAGGKPTPMLPHEVAKIIQTETEETEEAPKLDIKFAKGEKVKVKEGNFESFEGEVGSIDEASGRVTVMINIFGRSTPVELEYWQIEAM